MILQFGYFTGRCYASQLLITLHFDTPLGTMKNRLSMSFADHMVTRNFFGVGTLLR